MCSFGVLTPLLLKPFQRVIDERENKTDGARAEVDRLKDLASQIKQLTKRALQTHVLRRVVSVILCAVKVARKRSGLLAQLVLKFSKH